MLMSHDNAKLHMEINIISQPISSLFYIVTNSSTQSVMVTDALTNPNGILNIICRYHKFVSSMLFEGVNFPLFNSGFVMASEPLHPKQRVKRTIKKLLLCNDCL